MRSKIYLASSTHSRRFGLGIRKLFWPLIDVLRRKSIRRLVITELRDTSLEEDTLILAKRDFKDIAYELKQVATRFSEQSRVERYRHAHNELLSRHFPSKFPRDETPYRKGVIVTLLRRARRAGAVLSREDSSALLEQASAEAPMIAKSSPRELYQLQRDFELAGLSELIERFDADIDAGHPESFWQNLLKINPFILSMLFGYPIVIVSDQAHVGGTRLDGSGETIVDFPSRQSIDLKLSTSRDQET